MQTKVRFIKQVIFFVTFFLWQNTIAQELPPITNYTPSDYGADNQNWQASQAKDGIVYFANNKGLLSFNGAQWHLNSSPNETILRSVQVVDERIYTGAHMDFGYWEKQDNGVLSYTSLKDSLNVNMIEGEQIWKIFSYKGKVLLQSLNGIYIYHPETNTIDYLLVDTKNAIYWLFEIDSELFFQVEGKGLFTIKDGKAVLYDDRELFKTKTFISLFKRNADWLGITQKDGIYTITPLKIEPWNHEAAEALKNITVYRSKQLSDGSIALGTIANGYIKLTNEGKIDHQLTQDIGLGNNTVLSIFEDNSNNIWIGLDSGISCVNTMVPIRNYFDRKGRLGTTYASAVHKEGLYVGTNQGLFYRAKGSFNFVLVPGTEEQVWTLRVINGDLFCGHNNGTFVVNNGRQQQVGYIKGTWNIRKIPGKPNLLIQGNYDGLYVLQKTDGKWAIRNKLVGFDVSSRYFEFVTDQKILVSNEYKGVYEVEADTAFAKAKTYRLNSSVDKEEHSSLAAFEGSIYYANKRGIYRYNAETGSFEIEKKLSDVFDNQFVSGKLVNDDVGRLWAFTESGLVYFTKDALESELSINKVQIPQKLRNTAKGFENITALSPKEFLLGTTNGFLTIGARLPVKEHAIFINQIERKQRDGVSKLVSLSQKGNFLWEENNVAFSYHVTEFEKFQQTEYQYRLEGFYDAWSDWSTVASQKFTNIPACSYTFEVRARVGGVLTTNVSNYTFTIGKPWFTSYLAIAAYVVLGLLVIVTINSRNKRRYKIRKNQFLEKTKREMDLKALAVEKENIELRNQNLRNDIKARNRELAASTFAMVSKSKTLSSIKEKLSKLEKTNELETVIKDINKNISTNEDWSFFEKAFNQADQDFFKKIKQIHPQLTTNDLKLCVYLRLNMSSKEIAPLLNISHRSVEIKRYRLRKKINLDRSVHLNDYFINL